MQCVDLLGTASRELADLIGAARAPTPLGNRRPKGRASRMAYDEQGVLIAALRPAQDQEITAYKVRPLNISSTGVGFLHGAFVYPGTVCSLIARDLGGVPRQLTGHVVRCRLIQGRVHEVGVRFDEPIDLTELVEGATDDLEEPEGPIEPSGGDAAAGTIIKANPEADEGAEPEADAEKPEPEADADQPEAGGEGDGAAQSAA